PAGPVARCESEACTYPVTPLAQQGSVDVQFALPWLPDAGWAVQRTGSVEHAVLASQRLGHVQQTSSRIQLACAGYETCGTYLEPPAGGTHDQASTTIFWESNSAYLVIGLEEATPFGTSYEQAFFPFNCP